MELPEKIIKAEGLSPQRVVIYGLPKMGKTTALTALENCLIVDFEKGSNFVDALKVRVNSIKDLGDLILALEAKQEELGGKNPYPYLALDTVSALEELILPTAARDYKATPMGKNWNGKDVRTLPNGAGYLYIRNAFQRVVDKFDAVTDHLILVGHVKDSMVDKMGKEVNAKDLDLAGKLRNIVCSKADAVAYAFRKKDGIYLNFKSSDELTCGSRCLHLRGQEIHLGELNEDGTHDYKWEQVFLKENN